MMPSSTFAAVNVGFAGLGRMGLPMARRILAAEFSLAVWNRTPARAEELAVQGARVAATPRDVAVGAAMKLANNAIVAITHEAIAEALVFAEHQGIARESAYEVFTNAAVASPLLLYKRAAFLEPASEPVMFTIALMRKDVDLALELARNQGVALPATSAARDVLDAAYAAGLADDDVARVVDVIAGG